MAVLVLDLPPSAEAFENFSCLNPQWEGGPVAPTLAMSARP